MGEVTVKPYSPPGAVSLDQLNEQFKGQFKATPQQATKPPPEMGEYSVSDLNKTFDNFRKPPAPAPKKHDYGHDTLFNRENERLAGEQFMMGVPNKKHLVGEGVVDDADEIYIKGPKGERTPTDRRKHAWFYDPEDEFKLKVYNRHPDDELNPITGRLVGLGRVVNEGFATGAPAAGPKTAIQTGGQNLLGYRQGGVATEQAKGAMGGGMVQHATEGADIADAANRLERNTGVAVPVPKSVASDSNTVQRAAGALSAVPVSGSPIHRGVSRMGEGIAQAAEAVGELPTGQAVNPRNAGQSLFEGITEHIRGGVDKAGNKGYLAGKIEGMYDNVKNAFTRRNVKYHLQETEKVAQQILKEHQAAGYTDVPESLKLVLDPIKKNGLNYDSVRYVRSRIGEMLHGGSPIPEGMSEGQLKQLYGALKDDTRNYVAIAGGPKAVKALDRADQYTQAASARREALAKLINVDGEEKLFHKVHDLATDKRPANIQLLHQAKRALDPDQWKDVAAGVIGRFGHTPDGFSPVKFFKDFNSLSPQGKSALFGDSTVVRESLEDIVKIAQKWPDAKKMLHNTSHGGMAVDAAAAMGSMYMAHNFLSTGDPKHLVTAVAALLGTGTLSHILASPVTARSAATWARRAEALRLNPGSSTVAAFNNATNDLEEKLEKMKK